MSKGTPHRPIRIDADLWAKAQAKAAQEGTTASAKARDLLDAWVADRHVVASDELSAASYVHIFNCPECYEKWGAITRRFSPNS
jgi:plasmid stability protein